jgi:hypothetical protein
VDTIPLRGSRDLRAHCSVIAIGTLAMTSAMPDTVRSQAEAPRADAVRELAIPGDGRGYFFDRIGALSIGPDSTIRALLPRSSTVLVFSPAGEYVRSGEEMVVDQESSGFLPRWGGIPTPCGFPIPASPG